MINPDNLPNCIDPFSDEFGGTRQRLETIGGTTMRVTSNFDDVKLELKHPSPKGTPLLIMGRALTEEELQYLSR